MERRGKRNRINAVIWPKTLTKNSISYYYQTMNLTCVFFFFVFARNWIGNYLWRAICNLMNSPSFCEWDNKWWFSVLNARIKIRRPFYWNEDTVNPYLICYSYSPFISIRLGPYSVVSTSKCCSERQSNYFTSFYSIWVFFFCKCFLSTFWTARLQISELIRNRRNLCD